MGHDHVRIRPHHVLCLLYLPFVMSERGEVFLRKAGEIKQAIISGEKTIVEVAEGVDEMCRSCPECRDGRCESIHGGEHKVLKWDGKILEGLGISYGDKLKAREVRSLVMAKAPLAFCLERCPWGSVCGVHHKEEVFGDGS